MTYRYGSGKTADITLTVRAAYIQRKQLTLTKIKNLPIINSQTLWVDQYRNPFDILKIVGKIPQDIALGVCNKRGYYTSLSTMTPYHCGLIIHFDEQLYLTMLPELLDDFALLSKEFYDLTEEVFCGDADYEDKRKKLLKELERTMFKIRSEKYLFFG
jgi:hypothetical protein